MLHPLARDGSVRQPPLTEACRLMPRRLKRSRPEPVLVVRRPAARRRPRSDAAGRVGVRRERRGELALLLGLLGLDRQLVRVEGPRYRLGTRTGGRA